MNKRTKRLLAMMSSKPKLRKISGLPPLTYTAKEEGTLNNYRIYGNTVSGESVGDKTANLFDGELTDGYHLSDTTGLPVSFARRFATLQPITINQSEYCLTYNSTTDLRFMYSVFNNDTLIRRVAIVNNRCLQSGDAIDTTGGNKIYFAFYNNDYSHASTGMISNIMLNEGSTAIPYEPYGYKVPVTVEGKNLVPSVTYWEDGYINYADGTVKPQLSGKEKISPFIKVNNNDILTFSYNVGTNAKWAAVAFYDDNKSFISRTQQITTTPISISINISNVSYIKITCNTFDIDIIPMLNSGSEPLPYEPYHAPITTSIYLPEPIKMVGDEAEYIDFMEQKQHFADGTSVDVTLPALPTLPGTNVLSVGTEVQPSEVEVTGRIRPVPTGGGE